MNNKPTMCVALAMGLLIGTAHAIEKTDETFSSELISEGGFSKPANAISKGIMGQKVLYWAKWRNEDPSHHVNWRCVVTFHEESDAVVDLDFTTPDDRPEGYTYCGLDTNEHGLFEGTYRFIIYADGKKFSEDTIKVEKTFLSRLHLSPLTLVLAAIGLVIVVVGRLRKKE